MRVLVTGAAGRLGAEVLRQLQARSVDCLGADAEDFDVRDGLAVHNAVQAYAPDAIIHCAAYPDVDLAETEPEKCMEINGIGTLNIVRAALAVNAKLLYVSDAAVFSGTGTAPWEANERPNPRSVYGLGKAQGEEAIRSLMTRFFILRTSWLYGGERDDFVKQIARRCMDRSEVSVSCTEYGSPTCVSDLARLICDMIFTDRFGIYHATSQGYCSPAELAQAIVRLRQGRLTITPVETSSWITKHPSNARLSTVSLTQNGFTPLPHWEKALDYYLLIHN